MKNILVIAAHPDDEIIGLGGTLYKHRLQGDEVYVVILGDGKTSRDKKTKIDTKETEKALKTLKINKFFNEFLPDNRFDEIILLDLVRIISDYVKKIQPKVVYTHHFGDLNIDHKLTSQAVITACRPIENSCVEEIRMFETLSATEMGGNNLSNVFLPNLFIDIEDELETKLKAMGCYASELREFPHPRSLKAIEYNAYLWGAKNNIKASEAFLVFRSIKKTP